MSQQQTAMDPNLARMFNTYNYADAEMQKAAHIQHLIDSKQIDVESLSEEDAIKIATILQEGRLAAAAQAEAEKRASADETDEEVKLASGQPLTNAEKEKLAQHEFWSLHDLAGRIQAHAKVDELRKISHFREFQKEAEVQNFYQELAFLSEPLTDEEKIAAAGIIEDIECERIDLEKVAARDLENANALISRYNFQTAAENIVKQAMGEQMTLPGLPEDVKKGILQQLLAGLHSGAVKGGDLMKAVGGRITQPIANLMHPQMNLPGMSGVAPGMSDAVNMGVGGAALAIPTAGAAYGLSRLLGGGDTAAAAADAPAEGSPASAPGKEVTAAPQPALLPDITTPLNEHEKVAAAQLREKIASGLNLAEVYPFESASAQNLLSREQIHCPPEVKTAAPQEQAPELTEQQRFDTEVLKVAESVLVWNGQDLEGAEFSSARIKTAAENWLKANGYLKVEAAQAE